MKVFRYDCGCFMTIDNHGCGAGKHCGLCINKQEKDGEEYTGFFRVPIFEFKNFTVKVIESIKNISEK